MTAPPPAGWTYTWEGPAQSTVLLKCTSCCRFLQQSAGPIKPSILQSETLGFNCPGTSTAFITLLKDSPSYLTSQTLTWTLAMSLFPPTEHKNPQPFFQVQHFDLSFHSKATCIHLQAHNCELRLSLQGSITSRTISLP